MLNNIKNKIKNFYVVQQQIHVRLSTLFTSLSNIYFFFILQYLSLKRLIYSLFRLLKALHYPATKFNVYEISA